MSFLKYTGKDWNTALDPYENTLFLQLSILNSREKVQLDDGQIQSMSRRNHFSGPILWWSARSSSNSQMHSVSCTWIIYTYINRI